MRLKYRAIIIMMAALGQSQALAVQTTWFVDSNQDAECGNQNGESWGTSYKYLQDMLADSRVQEGDTIRVAQGTYRPDDTCATPDSGDRTATFQLIQGVVIEGGYNGLSYPMHENERSSDRSLTVLSGDLDGDDVDAAPLTQTAREENSLVVVTAGIDSEHPVDETTKIDGFTIRDGHHFADDVLTGADGDGAGIRINALSNPFISNCIVTRNAVPNSKAGGGLYNASGVNDLFVGAILEWVDFIDNRAGYGGGMAIYTGAANLTDCKFLDNNVLAGGTHAGGGGFDIDGGSASMLRCEISGNKTDDAGSGIDVYGGGGLVRKGGYLRLRRSEVVNNMVKGSGFGYHSGGGIATLAGGQLIAVWTDFDSNTVEGYYVRGGGLAVDEGDSAGPGPCRIINCTFSSNHATSTSDPFGYFSEGGGIYMTSVVTLELTNVLLYDNNAWRGGGIIGYNSAPIVTNCTFAKNTADILAGGATFVDDNNRAPNLSNCILWGNDDGTSTSRQDEQIMQAGAVPITVTYSTIEDDVAGTSPFPYSGSTNHNFDLDPLFIAPLSFNFQLDDGSPCIDAGNNPAVPPDSGDVDDNPTNDLGPNPLDIFPHPRFIDGTSGPGQINSCSGIVDMGVFEYQYQCADCLMLGDLNFDGVRDGKDIQPFVDCFLAGNGGAECGCTCGDYVGHDGVEINDVPYFVACLLTKDPICELPTRCDEEGPRSFVDCNENEIEDSVDIFFCDAELDPGLCDCNENGVPDVCDIADCESDWTCADVNENGVPDGCDPDCNGNQIPDDLDIANCSSDPACADCNANGIPDGCEQDCDQNGVPDECDLDPTDPDGDSWVDPDCNQNGVVDACDIDCDANGVPDECDLDPTDPDGDSWVDPDCNENGYPDSCDIDLGPPFGSMDCNENDIPDECDIASCDPETDPSMCDCNENGVPDGCDIAAEVSEDLDENGVPDECEQEMMMMGPMMSSPQSSPDYSEMTEAEFEAWNAYFLWCIQQSWGPDSPYSGLQQYQRLVDKKTELGL